MAEYWYLDHQQAGRSRQAVTLDEPLLDRLGEVLGAINGAIAAGLFVAHPDPPDPWRRARCRVLRPRRRRHRDPVGQWRHKRDDPASRRYLALVREHWHDADADAGDLPAGRRRTVRWPTTTLAPRSPPTSARTLFVAAGAGSGKTTQLVERVAGPRPGRDADRVHRRHHLHGQGGRRAAPAGAHGAPTPGGRDRTDGPPTTPPAAAAAPSTSSTRPRSARCTRSRSGSSPPTRSKRVSRPAVAVLDEIASDLDFEERFQAFYAELDRTGPISSATMTPGPGARHHPGAPARRGRALRRQLGPRPDVGRARPPSRRHSTLAPVDRRP